LLTPYSWFVALQVQTNETVPALGLAPTLGIDLGLAAFASWTPPGAGGKLDGFEYMGTDGSSKPYEATAA
jgi:hypothetical protein